MRRRGRLWRSGAVAALVVVGLNASAAGQDRGVPAGQSAPRSGRSSTRVASDTLLEEIDYLNSRLDEAQAEMNRARSGSNRIVVAGDASPSFRSQKGSASTFDASLSPLLLWRPGDRLLFEGAFDIGLSNDAFGNGQTSFDLVHANLSYVLNDFVTIRAGLFLVPFGVFHNHYDPPWIDPLPDSPLPFGDAGIAPLTAVGFDVESSVRIGAAELHGHLYAINGPRLVTDDSTAAGTLRFDNFDDNNNEKTAGGRLALRPVEELEFGYSAMYGRVGAAGPFEGVNALLQAVDAEYRGDIDRLWGRIDLRAELVLSRVDRATYGRNASPAFGPLSFANNRDGGYVQAAYRPWMIKRRFIRDLGVAARYDWLRAPFDAPGGDREERLILGLDYWLRPSLVLKAAYELDEKKLGEDANALLLQVGIGL